MLHTLHRKRNGGKEGKFILHYLFMLELLKWITSSFDATNLNQNFRFREDLIETALRVKIPFAMWNAATVVAWLEVTNWHLWSGLTSAIIFPTFVLLPNNDILRKVSHRLKDCRFSLKIQYFSPRNLNWLVVVSFNPIVSFNLTRVSQALLSWCAAWTWFRIRWNIHCYIQ